MDEHFSSFKYPIIFFFFFFTVFDHPIYELILTIKLDEIK